MPVKLHVAAGTHPGMRRNYNQDNAMARVVTLENGSVLGLLVVADGVGGQKAGDIASRFTVEMIHDALRDLFEAGGSLSDTQPVTTALLAPSSDDRLYKFLETRLNLAIQAANSRIREYAAANPDEAGNMRSTVTCALVYDLLAVVANVGDSRTYLYRDDVLQQLTADHSVVGQLVRDGQLAPEAVFTHPRRNVITRALGNLEQAEADFGQHFLLGGDLLLLCSDGLWEMVTSDHDKMKILAETNDLNEGVQRLISAANVAGGEDNISVVLAHVQYSMPESLAATMPEFEFDPNDLPAMGSNEDTFKEYPRPDDN